MFKIFTGFHLVEHYHKMKKEKRSSESHVLRKLIFALITIAVTLIVWNLPADSFGIQNLTVVQQRIIAIFVFATLMWIFEVVPSWATSIAVIVLMLLTTSNSAFNFFMSGDVGEPLQYKSIMASFADPIIMLFIGGFVLAIAATKTGLDAQLAKVLLKPFGSKSNNVLLGFILITGIFSMFISNTATAAMMLTFLTPVFKQLPPEGKGRIALALSIPVAANLGGMATPIGTPPNTIALKYLNDPEGLNMNLGFGEWVLFMLPLVLVLLFIGWLLLRSLFPFTQKTVQLEIEGEMKKDWKTYTVIVTFIVTVLLWLFDKYTGVNSNTVAMIPFMVFALTGIINKYDLEEINWSVLWMVAGGFALGDALNASGLAANAVESIPFGMWSPVLILVVSGLICYLLSNFISNSATAALLMPILLVVCTGMGEKLGAIGGTPTVLIGIAVASSSAMILPISTPPNALAFSTNLVKQNDMVKIGIIMGVISMEMGYLMLYLLGTNGML
ncbi:MAG: SLC13/DASS family transporter [Prevotella sp.]|nr:SLC13/DASS family transporter [Prevotella sp.]